jgi:nucleoside-diphosphate-sugar epimerase
LRPHIYTGAAMQNYLVGALRGTPTGHGKLAEWLRRRGTRLPLLLPFGAAYLENKFQFVHVDDMARLITWLLRTRPESTGLTVLNVAGRGAALSFRECLKLGKTKCLRLPGRTVCRWLLQLLWAMGVSGVPPEALPYMTGSYTMNTARLEKLLAEDYTQVVQHTVRDALADCFHASV